jgi:small subunit ribosomal protein S27e
MPLARDLLHPSIEDERRKHKKKRLVQSPNSYFMDVKCPGCYKITTGKLKLLYNTTKFLSYYLIVFSHAQTVVLCVGCNYVLCSPSGGKARLTEGCSFRKKRDTPLARKDDAERN